MDTSPLVQNSRKIINAWCSYDAANSVYNLIITSALFPVYYQEITKKVFGSNEVIFAGFHIRNTVLYNYAAAAAYAVIIILTPLLSGVADLGGYRKKFMFFFTFIGAISCSCLFWFKGGNIEYGIILVALGFIGYAGSLVYYNSFLPIIASPDRHDKISARGFSWGYIGGMILLIINLITISNSKKLGFHDDESAIRFSFLLVGVWWLLVSQIAFYYLKEYPGKFTFKTSVLSKGFITIIETFKDVRKRTSMSTFLLAFWFLSMGVQTVMLVAAQFGSVELGLNANKLIMTILLIQILGVVGSFLFGRVSTYFGNKLSLIIMLVIWIFICIWAYFITTEYQFYVIAALVGMVMGGIQSQSRSTYSKLLPENTTDTASYFTFYDITEKVAIVIGMFGFGLMEHVTKSMRNSTILLSIFFLISLIILLFSKLNHKRCKNISEQKTSV
jgi:MFS transporter, UMF1 family